MSQHVQNSQPICMVINMFPNTSSSVCLFCTSAQVFQKYGYMVLLLGRITGEVGITS